MKTQSASIFVSFALSLLLTGCGSIGGEKAYYEWNQYKASPEGKAAIKLKAEQDEIKNKERIRLATAEHKKECQVYQSNWHAVGYAAGKDGKEADSYALAESKCEYLGIQVNKPKWTAGYIQGLKKEYCVYKTALYAKNTTVYDIMKRKCFVHISEQKKKNMALMFEKGVIMANADENLNKSKQELSWLLIRIESSNNVKEKYSENLDKIYSLKSEIAIKQSEVDLLRDEANSLLAQLK